jgi:hypothetical protein
MRNITITTAKSATYLENVGEEEPQSNLARLHGHLKVGSLAAELVAARIAAGDGDPRARLRKAMLDRIDALRAKHDPV